MFFNESSCKGKFFIYKKHGSIDQKIMDRLENNGKKRNNKSELRQGCLN